MICVKMCANLKSLQNFNLQHIRTLSYLTQNWSYLNRDVVQKTWLCNAKSTNSGICFQKRHLSYNANEQYFTSDTFPVSVAIKTLETLHELTGLPWWGSIGVATLALKIIINAPFSVYAAKVNTKVEKLHPEIMDISKRLRLEVAHASKKYGWGEEKSRRAYNSTMKKKIGELYVRDNCHPFKSILSGWIQLPIWVSISFALRNMCLSGSDGLTTGGMLWFQDLTLTDSTFILPTTLGILTLLNTEFFSLQRKEHGPLQKKLTIFLRSISLLIVPISAMVPVGMCYYWVLSSMIGLCLNMVIKVPKVRRYLKIEKTSSESLTPFKDIFLNAKTRYMKK